MIIYLWRWLYIVKIKVKNRHRTECNCDHQSNYCLWFKNPLRTLRQKIPNPGEFLTSTKLPCQSFFYVLIINVYCRVSDTTNKDLDPHLIRRLLAFSSIAFFCILNINQPLISSNFLNALLRLMNVKLNNFCILNESRLNVRLCRLVICVRWTETQKTFLWQFL